MRLARLAPLPSAAPRARTEAEAHTNAGNAGLTAGFEDSEVLCCERCCTVMSRTPRPALSFQRLFNAGAGVLILVLVVLLHLQMNAKSTVPAPAAGGQHTQMAAVDLTDLDARLKRIVDDRAHLLKGIEAEDLAASDQPRGVAPEAGSSVFTYGTALKDKRCSGELWNDPSLDRAAAEAKCNSNTACKGLMRYNNGASSSFKYQGCGGSVASSPNTDWDTFPKLTGPSFRTHARTHDSCTPTSTHNHQKCAELSC